MKQLASATLALIPFVVAGCGDDLLAPDDVLHATPIPTRSAAVADYERDGDIDLGISYGGGDGNDLVLAFYNPVEDVLSVHATSDDFACGTQTTLKPLSDRLVAEPIEDEHLNQMGPVFTQVYGGVTRTGLEDFVADHCLYLDVTSPLARGTANLHFTALDATSHDTAPYTLTITGSLLDGPGGGQVHLILVRQYLITSSGARAAYPLKWVGPSLSAAR